MIPTTLNLSQITSPTLCLTLIRNVPKMSILKVFQLCLFEIRYWGKSKSFNLLQSLKMCILAFNFSHLSSCPCWVLHAPSILVRVISSLIHIFIFHLLIHHTDGSWIFRGVIRCYFRERSISHLHLWHNVHLYSLWGHLSWILGVLMLIDIFKYNLIIISFDCLCTNLTLILFLPLTWIIVLNSHGIKLLVGMFYY